MNIYKFRDCLLNTLERSVIRDNNHLELTTKTFDVLQYLIENAGKVVTKDEILGRVWNGSFVEESNLPVHISKLRRLLDQSIDRRFIETVQGTGYRFIAPLETVGQDEWELAAMAGNANRLDHAGRSIAILPLENESGDPAVEYLVDGLTESLINGLSQIPNLKVISRNTVFRYKNQSVDAAEIANALGVSNVLTGRLRLAGDNLLFCIELTETRDGIQLWGSQYDVSFSEIVHIKEAIVNSVSTILTSTLRNSNAPSSDGDADSFKFYLMGKYFLRKRTVEDILKAINYFRKSVSCCPTNVISYVSIVNAYRLLYIHDRLSRTETILKIAPSLEVLSTLDQSLGIVHVMYGKLKLQLDWDVESASQCMEKALQLNPNLVEAHSSYGDIMALLGKHAEVEYHAQQILHLDPISPFTLSRVGRLFYRSGNYERALFYLHDAVELEACDYEALLLLGATYTELEDYEKATEFLRKSYDSHRHLETLSMIGFVEGLAGRKNAAIRIIERINSELRDHHSHSINLARIYLALDEKEKMYALLDEAYDQHLLDMYALASDPRWKAVSTENRFQSLVQRVREASGRRPTVPN